MTNESTGRPAMDKGMDIEEAKSQLQAAISAPGGKYWAYTPAVSSLIAALEQAQQKASVYDMLREDYSLSGSLAEFVDRQATRITYLENTLRGTEESLISAVDQVTELESRPLCVKPNDAMREAAPLCVKLPMPYDINVAGERVDWAKGDNYDRDEVIEAIRAAGGTAEGSE